MRIVSAHQLDFPLVLRLPGPTWPHLELLFPLACDSSRVNTWHLAGGSLASLGVGDGYQCWVVGVLVGQEAICWVFCVASPFVSIYGVVLPIVAVMIPSLLKRISICLFEVRKLFHSVQSSPV